MLAVYICCDWPGKLLRVLVLQHSIENRSTVLDKAKFTFNELIKFLEHVVAEQAGKIEVQCAYNVFDTEQRGHVRVSDLDEALERMYKKKLAPEELQELLSLADLDNDGIIKEEGE